MNDTVKAIGKLSRRLEVLRMRRADISAEIAQVEAELKRHAERLVGANVEAVFDVAKAGQS